VSPTATDIVSISASSLNDFQCLLHNFSYSFRDRKCHF